MKNDLLLFCTGKDCLLRDGCHRYIDGKELDKRASGYSWMEHCEEEERQAYVPRNRII